MRTLMGVIKDRHGTYYARKKVPQKLEVVVAKIAGSGKPRVSWLKASLRTKDLKQANREAKAHLARFDQLIAEAEAAVAERPLRTSLTSREMERMAAYHYALCLGDDEVRRTAGLSLAEFNEEKDNNAELLAESRYALARGDIEAIADFLTTLLDLSKINLDPAWADYRRLVLHHHTSIGLGRRGFDSLGHGFKQTHFSMPPCGYLPAKAWMAERHSIVDPSAILTITLPLGIACPRQ
jgi:hypothetical protein